MKSESESKKRQLIGFGLVGLILAIFIGSKMSNDTPEYKRAEPTPPGIMGEDIVGCSSKDSLKELGRAATNRDLTHFQSLLGGPCYAIGGKQFSVVQTGLIRSQVRVYFPGSNSMLLWVPSEYAK